MEPTAQGSLGRDAHVRRGGEAVRLTSCGSNGVFGLRGESCGARRVLPPGRAQRWSARRLSLGTDDQVDPVRRLRQRSAGMQLDVLGDLGDLRGAFASNYNVPLARHATATIVSGVA